MSNHLLIRNRKNIRHISVYHHKTESCISIVLRYQIADLYTSLLCDFTGSAFRIRIPVSRTPPAQIRKPGEFLAVLCLIAVLTFSAAGKTQSEKQCCSCINRCLKKSSYISHWPFLYTLGETPAYFLNAFVK